MFVKHPLATTTVHSDPGSRASRMINVRYDGPWSRCAFGDRILRIASEYGDNMAVMDVLVTFPHLNLNNASLWLAYMKDARAQGSVFDNFIMDSFRRTDWFAYLTTRNGRNFWPDLAKLLPEAHNFNSRTITQSSNRPEGIADTLTNGSAQRDTETPSPAPVEGCPAAMGAADPESKQPSPVPCVTARGVYPASSSQKGRPYSLRRLRVRGTASTVVLGDVSVSGTMWM
ncbi:hypothetical protein AURDEDRAFT_176764 [Auricularia subglabra TFB-10046 SS5]|uniref:Uncharacterized protein n=1 Tax=Auricularia subglabra (strain TFB-10046 / SS5) TaxID=717982 RepID=J0CUY2_AURST|nr:hypothetical protein AURDEDRAFT_176764 [Auricularia subglabra TFB-10046 SS5]